MALASRIKVVPYEALPGILQGGTYIFADLELLSGGQSVICAEIWRQLGQANAAFRLLNNPGRALRRYELLRRLHDEGTNTFDVYRATERRRPDRFPVFIRHEREHHGSLTPLLHSREEADRAVLQVTLTGIEPREILVVEYCDTSDTSGLFRKYSAFRVGPQIVPRHLIFSRSWVLKYPDLLDASKIEEERRYLETNPHQDELMRIFEMAGIDYGRIDYALLGERIQVWEINTNPIVMLAREEYRREHLPAQEYFAQRIQAAFQGIDLAAPAGAMQALSLSADLFRGGAALPPPSGPPAP